MELTERLQVSVEAIRATIGDFVPRVGVVLGSGWGAVAYHVENPVYVSFADVPFMQVSTANAHVGRFVFGTMGGKPVVVMQGRLHGYEGYSAQDVAYPIWLMAKLGVKTLITTNAAGAVNRSYKVGDYCLMADQINFTGRNPLDSVEADHLASRFVGMLNCFDPDLRAVVRRVAAAGNFPLQEGVYLGLLGPSFETPAEIRAFGLLGADVVAMSVCEEVIAARHLGVGVIGISLVSNMACGIEGSDPNDDEVIVVGTAQEGMSADFIAGIVAAL